MCFSAQWGSNSDTRLTDMIILFFWTLSIFEFSNEAQCFGRHLQARKAPNLLDPLDRDAFLAQRQKYGWILKCSASSIS